MGDTKICSKCKTEKDVSCFGKDSSRKDGLYSSCRDCVGEKSKKRYLLHRDEDKARNKAWREANKERVQEYSKQYRQEHLDECRERSRRYRDEHLDSALARVRRWHESHPMDIKFNSIYHRAIRRGKIWNLTKE